MDWTTYCKLRDEPANDHLRMTYLDGDLTIVSPQPVHEMDAWGIMTVIQAVVQVDRIRYLCVGTTTLRKEGRGPFPSAGKEPDVGFYLGDDVARIRGKTVLDLAIDPPPSLALEVDNTRSSRPPCLRMPGSACPRSGGSTRSSESSGLASWWVTTTRKPVGASAFLD